MKTVSIQNIEEQLVLTQENNIESQFKVSFNGSDDKTVTLKGKGSLKELSPVK